MRKKWIMAAGLYVFWVTAGIACGTKEQEPQMVVTQEIVQPEEKLEDQSQEKEKSQELASLEGNIKSISERSAVMIRAETWEEGGSMFMTGRAPGYETEEDLVSLRFAEAAEYELCTVKNGGKNPEEDVSRREAAFSDMKEGMTVSIEGYYEDNVFVVTNAILYEFV